jgi:outer membrane protein assembly factor BamB/predicted MPP superfamily phosphohydrolase
MQITGSVLTDDGGALDGIQVSDGRSWTVTDARGAFTLETSAGRPVWARRPAIWPGGRWWAHAQPGVPVALQLRAAPAGIPGSAGRNAVRLAHLTDCHVNEPGDEDEFAARVGGGADTTAGLRHALTAATARGADLAVITGDLTDHGTEAELRKFAEVIADAPLHVEVVPGNHDHYGHLHDPDPGDHPRGGGFLGDATTTRYEQVLGPRWWSADLAGVHVVALDWFSAWCGIDGADQRRFVEADLSARDQGLPVMVLAHDLPDDGTLALLRQGAGPAGLLAVLTGHWHADTYRTVDGCHFLAGSSLAFGGLDWSPPQWRMIDLSPDGGAVQVRHEAIVTADARPLAHSAGPKAFAAVTASHALGAGQHLGSLTTNDESVLAPATGDDGAGLVSRIDPAAGLAWTVPAAGEPVTGLRAAEGQVLASSVAGRLVALAAASGEQRWAYQLPGRHRRRLLGSPLLTPDGRVLAGDIGAVACLDAASGDVRWESTGHGSPDTLLTYGTGLAAGSLAVLPFGGPGLGLSAMRLADGSLAWTDQPGTPPPSCSVVPVDDGEALVLRTDILERFELATGRPRWRTPLPGGFSTAPPLVTGDAIVLVTGNGIACYLDPGTGEIAASYQLRGLREAYGPYRIDGTGAPTAPVMSSRGPVVTLLDGSVWLLRPGGADLAADLGKPVTTQPVTTRSGLLAALATDATLQVVDLEA